MYSKFLKCSLLFIILLLISSNVFGAWEVTIPKNLDQHATDIIETSDNDIFIVGISESNDNTPWSNKTTWVKMGYNGTIIFDSSIYAPGYENSYSRAVGVIEDSDSNYVILSTAFHWNISDNIVHAIKVAKNGTILKNTTLNLIDKQFPHDIIELSSGNYMISGKYQYSNGVKKIFVAELNKNLEYYEWFEILDGLNTTDFSQVSLEYSNDNNFVIGYSIENDTSSVNELELIKISPTGTVIWRENYGLSVNVKYGSVVKLNDGYILTGIKGTFDQNTDYYSVKTNWSGDVVWARNIGSPDNEWTSDYRLAMCKAMYRGTIIAASKFPIGYYSSDANITRIDHVGNQQWVENHGPVATQKLYGADVCDDSSYIFAGVTTENGNSDIYVIRTDPEEYCCQNLRGNVDNSPDDIMDISDLLYLIEYMYYLGPAPYCYEEADYNASGIIDVTDQLDMIDYMFAQPPGSPPDPCPTY